MSDTDAIDDKKDTNNDENNSEEKSNNWNAFGGSCIIGLPLSVVGGIMASNITYFTSLSDDRLDEIFPSDSSKEPYAASKGYKTKSKCSEKKPTKFDPWEEIPKPIPNDANYKPSAASAAMSGALAAVEKNPALEMGSMAANATGVPDPKALAASAASDPTKLAAAATGVDTSKLTNSVADPSKALAAAATGVDTSKLTGATDPLGANLVNAATNPQKKGGGMKEIKEKMKENTDKMVEKIKEDKKFGWPYTWKKPYSDCARQTGTINNYYYEVKGNAKGQIYDKEGTLLPDAFNNFDEYQDFVANKQTKITDFIKEQKSNINQAKKANNNQLVQEMNSRLKDYKQLQKYYNGSFFKNVFRNAKDWIASSAEYAFIKERSMLKWLCKKGKIFNSDKGDIESAKKNEFIFGIVGIIINVIIVLFILHYILFIGGGLSFWGSLSGVNYQNDNKKANNWKRGILYTLLLGFGQVALFTAAGVGLSQYFGFIYKMVIWAMVNDFGKWKDNIKKNLKYFPFIYGMLVILAAWASLEPLYGNVMAIVWLIMLLKSNSSRNAEIKKADK
jgi:hypothetical protein